MSHDSRQCRLKPFHSSLASTVVGWIRGVKELRFVAPYTPPPLTPEKVLAWRRGRQESLICEDPDAGPVAYAELVHASAAQDEIWIAHLVVDPARRGAGLGQAFTRRLLQRAFEHHRAAHVHLSVFEDNAPAKACYERCGFRAYARRPAGVEWLRSGPPLLDMRVERFGWLARQWKDRLAGAGAGADWPAFYRRYAALRRSWDPQFDERLALAFEASGLSADEPFLAADLGAGPGLLSEAIARRFPGARVHAFEAHPLSLLLGEGAMGEALPGRIVFEPADLRQSDWVFGRGGAFRLAASTLAAHWMSRRSLRRLYSQTAAALSPGGVFFNSDHVAPDSWLAATWARAALARAFPRRGAGADAEARQQAWTAFWADLKRELGVETLCREMDREFAVYEGCETGYPRGFHLAVLRRAGFEDAREIWRRGGEAVVLARKPAARQ